jgi:vacuolar-type H+-ATPase subunit I/STV1
MFLAKEKALYQNMNNLKAESNTFIGFFWTATKNEDKIIEKHSVDGTLVEPYDEHNIKKPTYFKSNEIMGIY